MLSTFLEPLNEYREYTEALKAVKKGLTPVRLTGCIEGQKAHFMQALSDDKKYRVIISENDMQARRLVESYRIFDENVLYYPAKDFIFYQADIQGRQLVRERMKVIESLIAGRGCTVITTIDAGKDKRLPFDRYKKACISINESSEVDIKALEARLLFLGYERSIKVENEGEFAIQGGIIDIYPLNAAAPVRIELWGDEIDTIRTFDPTSQRSIERIDGVSIYPAAENLYDKNELEKGLSRIKKEAKRLSDKLREEFKTEEAARYLRQANELAENIEYAFYAVNLDSYITSFSEKTESFFDYFPAEDTLFFIDEPARVEEHGRAVDLEYAESMENRLSKAYVLPSQVAAVISYKEALALLASKSLVLVSTLSGGSSIKERCRFDITAKSINSYRSDFASLVKDVGAFKKRGYRTIIVTGSRTRAKRLAEDLGEYDIPAFYTESSTRVAAPGEVMLIYGQLPKGFEYPLIKLVFISETDIFGAKKTPKKSSVRSDKKKLLDFNQLKVGDYVIHENHGLGIYRGLFEIESDHVKKDYIKLEYSGGGKLYVPVTALDMIQKYSGGDGEQKPKLASLSSPEWKTAKSRIKADINKIAEELVDLYAKRSTVKGFAFSDDNIWQREFEELFPYEETDDQLRAIADTKKDMESSRIMDRLVCGDVGYGKTEIALRAAFKAVQDSKQVAVLVPTTILAQQHYNTFVQRLQNFPVNIEMLSRFRSAKQISETLSRLKKGETDIVIGTHRLLSKDVIYKDLGLLVVDEEQRFGVTHKEKIKQIKTNVDVLTLSATPIPRTMHMSLVGIRDMSVLDEPPVDRMPIQTYVLEHNDELIREAINRELQRGGQVYYVHNRVVGIEDVAARLTGLLPDARIAYAHGRMRERELEKIMSSFIEGEIDVLISTTIIETGMDIPNVNTMIIDDADRFGLAQLYQLRGRVGRSSRTAYAFLMYRKDKILKEEAEKRLAAIKEFTELGAGVKIAMRDLEIRGAGNLLGERQSGHMSVVGYDLYCKMLSEAVKKFTGGEVQDDFETAVDMELDAFIPASYIGNEMIRLDIYKKISQIESEEDLSDLTDELVDRYGDMPEELEALLNSALIRSMAHRVYVTDLKQRGAELSLALYARARLDITRFPEFINSFAGRCRLINGTNPMFKIMIGNRNKKQITGEIKRILSMMQELL